MYEILAEEDYVDSIVEFKHLTIAQINLFLKRIRHRKDIENQNAKIAQENADKAKRGR